MSFLKPVLDLFKTKRRLKAHFLDEAGLFFTREVKYDNNMFSTKFGGKDHAYIVDHNFIFYDAKDRRPSSLYYVNNPNPVRLQHERNLEADSIGFKNIIDSKTVQDLFSPEAANKMMILIIMLGVVILLVIVVIAVQAGWLHLGTSTPVSS